MKLTTRMYCSLPSVSVALAIVVLLWLVGCHQCVQAQEAAKQSAKWEYCTLSGGENVYVFFTSKQEVRAKSWKEMANKLKAPLKEGWEEIEWVSRMAVFDFLGDQGWELVSYSRMGKDTTYSFEALFKRRR
jgi:hypothetical protein